MAIGRKKGMFPTTGSVPLTEKLSDDHGNDIGKISTSSEQPIGSLPPAGAQDEDDRHDVEDVEITTAPSRPTGVIKKKLRRVVLVPPASIPYVDPKRQDTNFWVIYDATSGESLGGYPDEGAARKQMDDEGYYE